MRLFLFFFFFVPENQIFRRMTAIDTVFWKNGESPVQKGRGSVLRVREELDKRFPPCLCLALSEHLVLQPGVLWSRILSFYRILMSLLPPPLFTTDKEWNWSVCGTAACALSSRHRHQEPRWENAIKLYTVYFNWSLDPFLLRGGWARRKWELKKSQGEAALKRVCG